MAGLVIGDDPPFRELKNNRKAPKQSRVMRSSGYAAFFQNARAGERVFMEASFARLILPLEPGVPERDIRVPWNPRSPRPPTIRWRRQTSG